MVSGPVLIILFIVSIALLVLLISKLKIHAFLSLLLVSVFMGLASGMKPADVLKTITDGFGGLMGYIGIVIVCGVIIGEILEVTGGAQKIADSILKLVGKDRSVLATGITGSVVSIPVFCDSGFVILTPIIKAISRVGKIPFMSLSIALMAGLLTTHAFVPPTPGPIAAAVILEADLGKVVIYGIIASIPVIIASVLWANSRYIKNRFPAIAEETVEDLKKMEAYKETVAKAPSTFKSYLPIVVPIVLIVLQSFTKQLVNQESFLATVINFLGTPFIALMIGAGLAFLLPSKVNGVVTDTWVSTAIEKSAVILLITAAGGSFGKVLQATKIGEVLGQGILDSGISVLIVPFVIAALSVIAQGSATVALLTTAAIVKPLLGTMGMSPELALLAISAGSFTGVHSNGSYFWVVSKLSNFNLKQSYIAVTVTTIIMGIVGFVTVLVMSLFV